MILLGTIWVRTRVMPRWLAFLTYTLAPGLLLSLSSSLWVTLLFAGRVSVVSVYVLNLKLRSLSTSFQRSLESSMPPQRIAARTEDGLGAWAC
jgi:hypothetical protein